MFSGFKFLFRSSMHCAVFYVESFTTELRILASCVKRSQSGSATMSDEQSKCDATASALDPDLIGIGVP